MLRGQSCFQLSAVEPITVTQTQSPLEGRHSGPLLRLVFYWRIFIFDFKVSPELWFHSSKGEAFPNIGQSQRWNTPAPRDRYLQYSAVWPLLLRNTRHSVVAWRIRSIMQGPRCSILEDRALKRDKLKELWKINIVFIGAASQYEGSVMLHYLGALLISGACPF